MRTNLFCRGAAGARASLLPVLLAILACGCWQSAWAANVTVGGTAGGGGSYSDLDTAIGVVNANAGSGSVTITLGGSESSSTTSNYVHWDINGMTGGYNDPINSFESVTFTGGTANNNYVLTGAGNGNVLRIINVQDAITVNYLTVTGGNLTASAIGQGEIGGGGMMLGGNGGLGTTVSTAPNTITLNGVVANSNSITVTGTSTLGNMFGGGIYVVGVGGDSSGPDATAGNSDVSFTNVTLTNNSLSLVGSNTDASIRGGGAHISLAKSFTYTTGTVTGNTVSLSNGSHAAGGGLSIDGGTTTTSVAINNVTFKDNAVEYTRNNFSLTENRYARGGGLYYNDSNDTATTVTIGSGTRFELNTATATASSSGMNNVIAMGGGAHLFLNNATATVTGTEFLNNTAESNYGSAYGGGISVSNLYGGGSNGVLRIANGASFRGNKAEGYIAAQGGAVYTDSGKHSITDSTFSNNQANATISTYYGNAAGGALYLNGFTTALVEDGHTVSNNTFLANSASGSLSAAGGAVALGYGSHTLNNNTFTSNKAESGSGGTARGGALYLNGGTSTVITDSEFSGNEARTNGGTALGGAIYLAAGELTITDSSLTGNTAWTNSTDGMGGAIFVDTGVTSSATGGGVVNLNATSGQVVEISGNKAGGRSDGIYFGIDPGSGSLSLTDAQLNIQGAGTVELLDPITVAMNNARGFTMTKNNSGTLIWDGKNQFTTTGSSASINLESGTVILKDNFTAIGSDESLTSSATDFNVHIGSAATLAFSISRDQTLAMFDFQNSGTTRFEVDNGATLTTDLGREIISNSWKFAVATGADQSDLDAAVNNFNFVKTDSYTSILGLAVEGNTLYATVDFQSPFDRSGINPRAALTALDSLLKANDGSLVSDDEYYALLANPWTSTPEIFMEQAAIMLYATDLVARTAVDYGARYPHRQRIRMEAAGIGYGDYPGEYGEYNEYEYYDAYPSLATCTADNGMRVWGGYIGDFSRRDTNGGYEGYKVERHGFVIGGNYDFGENGTIGVYGGYTNGQSTGRKSDAKVESDVGHFGLIARVAPLHAAPEFSIYADAGYHFSYNDLTRKVGYDHRAYGSFEQDVWTGAIGLEYLYCLPGMTIVPHAEVRLSHIDQKSLFELGNAATTTRTDGITENSVISRLGVEFSRDFQLASGIFTPAVNVSWKHEYGKNRYSSSSYFYNDPNPVPFAMTSSPMARNSADVGVSLRTLYQTGPKTIFGFNLAYNLNISRHSNNHSLYAGFDLGF